MAFACIILFCASFPGFAQDRGVGLGIIAGEPTGISLKGWLSDRSALDAGLAWSFVKETSFHLHADYILHSFNVFNTEERVPLYYGIGGRIKTAKREDTRLGLRMMIGVGYYFKEAPIDLFLEFAPIVDLAPATELRFNAGIGARYFFK